MSISKINYNPTLGVYELKPAELEGLDEHRRVGWVLGPTMPSMCHMSILAHLFLHLMSFTDLSVQISDLVLPVRRLVLSVAVRHLGFLLFQRRNFPGPHPCPFLGKLDTFDCPFSTFRFSFSSLSVSFLLWPKCPFSPFSSRHTFPNCQMQLRLCWTMPSPTIQVIHPFH